MSHIISIKRAAEGWAPDAGVTITQRFADYSKNQLYQTGALNGLAGALAAGAASAAAAHGEQEPDLPEFDPETGAYIGQAYKVPDTEDEIGRLYAKLLGKEWSPSAPRFLEWLLAKRPERIRLALVNALKKDPSLGDALSRGELASLVFPNILKNDGSISKILSIGHPYPTKGAFGNRPITKQDIDKYLAEHEDLSTLDKRASVGAVNDAIGGTVADMHSGPSASRGRTRTGLYKQALLNELFTSR